MKTLQCFYLLLSTLLILKLNTYFTVKYEARLGYCWIESVWCYPMIYYYCQGVTVIPYLGYPEMFIIHSDCRTQTAMRGCVTYWLIFTASSEKSHDSSLILKKFGINHCLNIKSLTLISDQGWYGCWYSWVCCLVCPGDCNSSDVSECHQLRLCRSSQLVLWPGDMSTVTWHQCWRPMWSPEIVSLLQVPDMRHNHKMATAVTLLTALRMFTNGEFKRWKFFILKIIKTTVNVIR